MNRFAILSSIYAYFRFFEIVGSFTSKIVNHMILIKSLRNLKENIRKNIEKKSIEKIKIK